MSEHEHFEELCALAATEQLSPSEEKELRMHLDDCEACRAACQDFILISEEFSIRTRHHVDKRTFGEIQEGTFRQQFLDRARSTGIRFSEVAENRVTSGRDGFLGLFGPFRWSYQIVAASLLLCALLGMLGVRQYEKSKALAATKVHAPETVVNVVPTTDQETSILALRSELDSVKASSEQQMTELQRQNALLLGKLATVEAERQDLQKALSRLNETNSQLVSENERATSMAAQAKADLEKAQDDRSGMAQELAAQKSEVNELSRQLRLETASLDHERELLAAGHDVTNLMGARNLHMIDVYDSDGKGTNRKSFGRVFYTEGKSLIFYAFDLDEHKLVNAKYTYQAWGERLGQGAPVRSLGILYMDDREQKRWTLKVDDPRALAEIDAVFVTLEPRTAPGDKPQGHKLLYAFLGGKPNHP